MQLVIIDGRIRRVLEIIGETSGDSTRIKVVSGFHTKRVTKRKHPGAGFRQVPGTKDKWVRRKEQITTAVVRSRAIVSVEAWPSENLKDLIPSVEGAYRTLLASSITGAFASEAARTFRRQPPVIKWATIEAVAKAEGLPCLSQDDLDVLIREEWEKQRPRTRSRKGPSAISEIVKNAKEQDDAIQKQRDLEREQAAVRRARETDRIVSLEAMRDQARGRGWPDEVLVNVNYADERNEWGRTLTFMSRVDFSVEKHIPDGWVSKVKPPEVEVVETPAPHPDWEALLARGREGMEEQAKVRGIEVNPDWSDHDLADVLFTSQELEPAIDHDDAEPVVDSGDSEE